MVNGQIDKCDGGFLGDFWIEQIGNTNIYIGSFPFYEFDVQKISKLGCKAVLNLQTTYDQRLLGLNLHMMQKFYRAMGINEVVNFPIDDHSNISENNMHIYADNLFKACCKLYELQKSGGSTRKVFVHCSSGMNRSPTLLIIYLCLFLKHP